MKKQNDTKPKTVLHSSVYKMASNDSVISHDIHVFNNSKLPELNNYEANNIVPHFLKPIKNETLKKTLAVRLKNSFMQELPAKNIISKPLFRFFVKNGEHVYGRADDIVVIESCDHLVNVYLAFNDKLKKAVRTNTLKDFLSILPAGQFIRISRFCAINIQRLSGGNCKDQTFEFDFRFSIKLKHTVPNSTFNCIGK